jgi:hypothetical protein
MDEHTRKRRKLGHASGNGMPGSSSSAFAFECEELLRESRLDFEVLGGVEELLRRLKGCMESIEARGSLPVG